MAGCAAVPRSTTRTGAIGGGVAVGGGGADEKLRGGSGTVREKSRGSPWARTSPGDSVSRCPHETQKRVPRWFALPQSGQLTVDIVDCCASPFGRKLSSGAAGR